MELNERIFYLLDIQGKSAKQLGEYINVSASSISGWKNEGSFPSSKYIVRISEFLGVSIEYLCTGVESNTSLTLTDEQQELFETYNNLDRRGRHRIHTIIYEELDRIESQSEPANIQKPKPYVYDNSSAEPLCMVAEDTSHYGESTQAPISVLGYVAAGEPILSYENAINTVVPESFKASYALIAKGNSMEPVIMDGEVIEVISQKELENGEIGIIKVDNAVTCKCFYASNKQYELKSLNQDMETIIIPKTPQSNVQIIGKVALTAQQQKRYQNL